MTYLDPDMIADETTNAEAALSALGDRLPGWEPAEHGIETVMAEAWGAALATAFQVARDELANAYQGLASVLNVPRNAATAATATTTWTFMAPAPATLPSGALMTATSPEGDPVDFVTTDDVVVAAGVAAAVPVRAAVEGEDANGTTGSATSSEFAVSLITFDDLATGGSDEEELDAFLSRLTSRASRMRALPITPQDYAETALDVPGVASAFALNRYDPAAPAADSPGHVTVFAFDEQGVPVGSGLKATVLAYFNAEEFVLGTTLHLADGTTTSVAVTATVTAAEGFADAAVIAAVQAAVAGALDRSQWDRDPNAPGRWAEERTAAVYSYDLAAVIKDLAEVDHVVSVGVNGGTSVALAAPLTLPVLSGAATVTVI